MRTLVVAALLRRARGLATASRGAPRCAVSGDGNDDGEARSSFGTKHYWDEMYEGRGDFDSESYSWYFGWDVIKPVWEAHAVRPGRVLLPGVGNDDTPRELWRAGWRDLYAFDYSAAAAARQDELNWDCEGLLCAVADARALDLEDASFDYAIEKGALDAVYLSGEGNLERAAAELARVLRPGGRLVSVSGVVPPDLREACFPRDRWEWLRDGAGELAAGFFVMERRPDP